MSKRPNRRAGIGVATWALWGGLALGASAVTAQEPTVRRPVAIVSLAGVDRLSKKVAALVGPVGDGEALPALVGGFLAGRTRVPGLDGSRRLCAAFPSLDVGGPGAMPLVFVPVADGGQFLAFVGSLFPVSPPGPDGVRRVSAPVPLFARVEGSWCVLAADPALLSGSLPDPKAWIGGAVERYDVALRIDLSAVPRADKERWAEAQLEQMSRQIGQLARKQPLVGALRELWVQAARRSYRDSIDGCKSLTVGLELAESRGTLALESLVEAQPGSRLAKTFDEWARTPGRFASLTSGGNAFGAAMRAPLPPEQRQALQTLLYSIRSQGAAGGAKGKDHELFLEFCDVLEENARSGHVDVGVSVDVAANGRLGIVGGARLLKAADAERVLVGLLRLYGGASPAFERVAVGESKAGDITIHGIYFAEGAARGFEGFGAKPSLHLGFGRDVVWFSVGAEGSSLESLRAAIARASRPSRVAQGERLVDVDIRLMRLVGVGGSAALPASAQRALSRGDRITARVDVERGVVRARVELAEGFLELFRQSLRERVPGLSGPALAR